ncbi:hypothetical protein BT96DRAFT_879527 [Gymnopus androsaceus JB14]|uniref:Concanavalin A-like lectin/glucanase n=1 Tax=Gymnopus androsaceus JB14 TaxID=1447944 RepID=A0A6A4HXW2_9AGAR|nr:hypothetical protein BT96DRAFT_879527 [Gymnopus androsaceus JB14]
MFKLKQFLKFTLVLLAATSTSVAGASNLENKKRSNETQCLDVRGLVERATPALSFASSDWIWTPELSAGVAPIGSRGFRKNFVPPQGKTPAFLTIAFSVDNEGTLYVNGNEITTQIGWNPASTTCIDLSDCGCSVLIAVNATNTASAPNPAGLLVDAVITYTDGTTSTIVSDTTWRASEGGIPTGFQELSFDDSTWPPAVSEGSYGIAPWGDIVLAGTDPLTFTPASWIWTDEVSGSGMNAPAGARAFLYTYTLPTGQTSASATIFITTDNEYSLYVNGLFIGSGTDFQIAQQYVVDNIQGPEIVFAAYAVNTLTVANPAGVLASIQVTSQNDYCTGDCTSTAYIFTDAAWSAFPGSVPAGFEQPGFDYSSWPGAVDEGAYGVAPWGDVPVPTTVTTGGTPLAGAPA